VGRTLAVVLVLLEVMRFLDRFYGPPSCGQRLKALVGVVEVIVIVMVAS
jgi:hypothetical protein